MFNKLLIANRGEIACRIIKTARRLGIETIAIYSTADKDSLHVAMADVAFCIGEPEARASYLNIHKIIDIAQQAGAQAIHPGYGFLSENPEFAKACSDAGIIFVGPSISAMEAMASKQLAKQLLSKSNVPLTPGYHDNDQTDAKLLHEAINIGFPVLLKAASGGGGKGMRIVEKNSDFQHALDSARREAQASFGDDIMIIEKYIKNPRHVEIQLMADNFGNVVHLFERDCSIQRRHQKIIEEAPAPNLSMSLRQQLAEAAVSVAKAIEYQGAGTVEFLVDGESSFYFMEMNTRLQVEHPVTEMITGIDLVEWQLRVANNERLPLSQNEIQCHGHAIECRIYAEDPHHDFMPSTGTIGFLKEPHGAGIRIETGITQNSCISMYYDPMIAKLITYGSSREEAILRMKQAIKHYCIGGVKTNLPLLQAIIEHPEFIKCHLSTHFLTQHPPKLPIPDIHLALLMAASFDYLNLNPPHKTHLKTDTFGWQMHLQSHWQFHYRINGENFSVNINPINHNTFSCNYSHLTPSSRSLSAGSRDPVTSLDHADKPRDVGMPFSFSNQTETITIHVKLNHNVLSIDDGRQTRHSSVDNQEKNITIYTPSGPVLIERYNGQLQIDTEDAINHQLTSPMPATVVAVLKHQGDAIKAGERLMVLEAMKMEHTILAPSDGIIDEVFFKVGEQVAEGAELIALKNTTEDHL